MTSQIQNFAAPLISLIFVAGGGWFTLEAVAEDGEQLQAKVEQLEIKVGNQDVIEVKVEQLQSRLDKMESMLEKTMEMQQKQMLNQAAICQATKANCR